jgi:nucleotide-binding universal stress UspA family protein
LTVAGPSAAGERLEAAVREGNETKTPTRFATILVGLDGSASSTRALTWASQFAGALGSMVVGVHVLTFNEEFIRDGMTPDTMRTWRRDLERDLRSRWMEPATAAGVPCTHHLIEAGSVDEGLLAGAVREKADLIVIGESGSSGVLARILDRASYRVMHRATHPVVIVPHGWCPNG